MGGTLRGGEDVFWGLGRTFGRVDERFEVRGVRCEAKGFCCEIHWKRCEAGDVRLESRRIHCEGGPKHFEVCWYHRELGKDR